MKECRKYVAVVVWSPERPAQPVGQMGHMQPMTIDGDALASSTGPGIHYARIAGITGSPHRLMTSITSFPFTRLPAASMTQRICSRSARSATSKRRSETSNAAKNFFNYAPTKDKKRGTHSQNAPHVGQICRQKWQNRKNTGKTGAKRPSPAIAWRVLSAKPWKNRGETANS